MNSCRFLLAALLLWPISASAGGVDPAPLSAYWPNEDGRQWVYDQHFELLVSPFTVTDNQARLYFEGTTTAPVGIAAQMLKGAVSSTPARERPDALEVWGVPSAVTDPLLRRLWVARPDLRERIVQTSAEQPCSTQPVDGWEPILLTAGFAYVKRASDIGAWRCDLSNTQSWLWLTSSLGPGSTAQLQLVPDLADDVFLHLTVLGFEDVTVPAGTYLGALHVDYFVDYGVTQCTDSSGGSVGTSRYETNGFIRFAAGEGPIESFEEFQVVLLSGNPCPVDPGTGTIARSSLRLNSPSVPARAASWGGVKAAYHR